MWSKRVLLIAIVLTLVVASCGDDDGSIAPDSTDPAWIEAHRDEAIAALHRVQRLPAIRAHDVGLWGISQEAWIISMAAADQPDDVAFIIPVSGAGISVAEQQVWGIESQSRAAGLTPDDVERATLFGRLLVDWQLAEALYLPTLRSIPPEQIERLEAVAEQTLLTDPSDHLTRVTSPVLAFFGEDDIVQPTDRSAELYAQYLDEAGNEDVTIVILPGVGHDITPSSPGYWEQLAQWLDQR
jgi:pimeloyl-ACP methyl ester carboxylesterase